MGTNFYKLNGDHIGKRSSAGLYCWDCKVTLCKEGEERVHHSPYDFYSADKHFYDKCPLCKKSPDKEDLSESAPGRELGFNTDKLVRKTGVKTCSSFSWRIDPDVFAKSRLKTIVDEYGTKYTRKEFEDVLSECPIRYTHSVGKEFC